MPVDDGFFLTFILAPSLENYLRLSGRVCPIRRRSFYFSALPSCLFACRCHLVFCHVTPLLNHETARTEQYARSSSCMREFWAKKNPGSDA
ncbi:MAG: hypothetical protein KKB63_02315, partial [Alphaproteobacteria bacterium]|nr:hypothetical protein [Alphaproteobacteria bacterium]